MAFKQDPNSQSTKGPASRKELYIGFGILLIGMIVALIRSC